MPPYYAVLRGETLNDVDFAQLQSIGNQRVSNSDVIKKIMRCFLRVRPKFGPVAASKLMHMAIPRLFVMWDTGIRIEYGIPTYYGTDHARNYLGFLKLMRLQINHATNCYSKAYDIDVQTTIEQLREKDKNSTLPRVIDKYNFAIRDGKLKICSKCAHEDLI